MGDKLGRSSMILLFLAGSLAFGQWHKLDASKMSKAQLNSWSYKFLTHKFGADHLLVSCDPDFAGWAGLDELYNVMDDGSVDHHIIGEAIGNGENLQAALDKAAAQYISGPRVKAIDAEQEAEDRRDAERAKRYRKLCCEK